MDVDIEHLLRHAGNIYEQVVDEETGQTLWDLYFKNPVTGEVEAFVAREKVTSGRKMRATYCPEHLHLYHLLTKVGERRRSGTRSEWWDA